MTIRPRAWLVAWVLLALAPAMVGPAHLKEQPKTHKVVYHLSGAGAEEAKNGSDEEVNLTLQHVYIRP